MPTAELVRPSREASARLATPVASAPQRFRLTPLEEPAVAPRPRGLIARLTAFFVAYHTA